MGIAEKLGGGVISLQLVMPEKKFRQRPTAKGVRLHVVDSHTGNHSEDGFTPLETIRSRVTYNKLGQSGGVKLHSVEDQLEAYNRILTGAIMQTRTEWFHIKKEAGMKTAKLHGEKKVQDREQHAEVEAQKNLEENLQQLESRKQKLESQKKQM
ncbi:hypothetical protein Tco_0037637 [Tanacetum coccineum]